MLDGSMPIKPIFSIIVHHFYQVGATFWVHISIHSQQVLFLATDEVQTAEAFRKASDGKSGEGSEFGG